MKAIESDLGAIGRTTKISSSWATILRMRATIAQSLSTCINTRLRPTPLITTAVDVEGLLREEKDRQRRRTERMRDRERELKRMGRSSAVEEVHHVLHVEDHGTKRTFLFLLHVTFDLACFLTPTTIYLPLLSERPRSITSARRVSATDHRRSHDKISYKVENNYWHAPSCYFSVSMFISVAVKIK